MPSPLSEFGKIAQNLARNPLGIIALFIVLVYGIAGLVLGMRASGRGHRVYTPETRGIWEHDHPPWSENAA